MSPDPSGAADVALWELIHQLGRHALRKAGRAV